MMKINVRILNKILGGQIQQHVKKNIQHDQVGFMPGMILLHENQWMWSITLTKWKEKKICMIISIDAWNGSDKIQHYYVVKTPLNKVVMGFFFQHSNSSICQAQLRRTGRYENEIK